MPVDVTTPSDREIQVVRRFNAPRQLVFDAHTRPEMMRRWMFGPPGWSLSVCEVDLKVGGAYRYRWRSDDGKNEFGSTGEHKEIVVPERLVTTERMEGWVGESLNTMVLTEQDGVTTLTLVMRFPTPELRDAALESGMTGGMEMGYARLQGLIDQGAV